MPSLRTISLVFAAWLLLGHMASAFEMSGTAYRVSAEMNSGAGEATSPNFEVSEFSIGQLYGSSGGAIYNITLGGFSPMQLAFIIGSPVFNPAELLVTFWRK